LFFSKSRAFDTSKQALAAVVVHFVNVIASYISSGTKEEERANPCVWYFLNVWVNNFFFMKYFPVLQYLFYFLK